MRRSHQYLIEFVESFERINLAIPINLIKNSNLMKMNETSNMEMKVSFDKATNSMKQLIVSYSNCGSLLPLKSQKHSTRTKLHVHKGNANVRNLCQMAAETMLQRREKARAVGLIANVEERLAEFPTEVKAAKPSGSEQFSNIAVFSKAYGSLVVCLEMKTLKTIDLLEACEDFYDISCRCNIDSFRFRVFSITLMDIVIGIESGRFSYRLIEFLSTLSMTWDGVLAECIEVKDMAEVAGDLLV